MGKLWTLALHCLESFKVILRYITKQVTLKTLRFSPLGGSIQVVNGNKFIKQIKEPIMAHSYKVKEGNTYSINDHYYQNLILNQNNTTC